jgi:16S rRNA processing protein RimM
VSPTGEVQAPVVAVGEIVGAHALRGLVRARAYQLGAPSLAPGRILILAGRGSPRELRVVSATPHARGLVLLGLEGVGDRTAAEALVGSRLLVRATDLPPPAEDEFYWHEVAGFSVETVDGAPVGVIVETFSTGANDVWVVHADGREQLIPVIGDVVRTIDRAGRRVLITPLPGLLD